jgi:DNA-binding transcriptional ArsR family regulator
VESAFEIIAEPNRRSILRLLAASQQSVGEIERQLGMPQPTVSKHLRMLREAGFVESTVDAQRRSARQHESGHGIKTRSRRRDPDRERNKGETK